MYLYVLWRRHPEDYLAYFRKIDDVDYNTEGYRSDDKQVGCLEPYLETGELQGERQYKFFHHGVV